MKLSDNQIKALKVLADHYFDDANCLFFRTVASESDLPAKLVRRTVRALARKGLAAYERGLFTDDGKIAGSGYYCTKQGFHVILELEKREAEREKVKAFNQSMPLPFPN